MMDEIRYNQHVYACILHIVKHSGSGECKHTTMLDTHAVPMHTLTRTKKNTNVPPVTTLDAHHIYSHIYLYVRMHVPCLYDLASAQVLLSTVYYQNDVYAL